MQKNISLLFLIVTASVIQIFGSGCAYNLSSQTIALPGNVKSIQIPLFRNDSSEVDAETSFTNALKTEAIRSNAVMVKNEAENAEAVLQGRIVSISVVADESVVEAKNTTYLPTETVLATQYRVNVNVELVLKKRSTNEKIWSGNFIQAQNFSAAQITLPVINTANSLYNESAKRQTLNALSKVMMQAAFDRMVENF